MHEIVYDGSLRIGERGTRTSAPKTGGMIKALARPRSIVGAIVAGLIAGCSIVACFTLLHVLALRTPGYTLAGIFAFDAAALVGKVALTGSSYVALGIALHFTVSIGWAIGYAVVAERQRQLVTRPLISGAVFGIIVYFAMQLVLVAANMYRTPTPRELGVALLAHIVFYGIPVALIVGRAEPPAGLPDAR